MNLKTIAAIVNGLSEGRKDRENKRLMEQERKYKQEFRDRQRERWDREDSQYPQKLEDDRLRREREAEKYNRNKMIWEKNFTRRPTFSESAPDFPDKFAGAASQMMSPIPGVAPAIGEVLSRKMRNAPSPIGENKMRDVPLQDEIKARMKAEESANRRREKEEDRIDRMRDQMSLALFKHNLNPPRQSGGSRGLSPHKGDNFITSIRSDRSSPALFPGMLPPGVQGAIPDALYGAKKIVADPEGKKTRFPDGEILTFSRIKSAGPTERKYWEDKIDRFNMAMPVWWEAALSDSDTKMSEKRESNVTKAREQYARAVKRWNIDVAKKTQDIMANDAEISPEMAKVRAKSEVPPPEKPSILRESEKSNQAKQSLSSYIEESLARLRDNTVGTLEPKPMPNIESTPLVENQNVYSGTRDITRGAGMNNPNISSPRMSMVGPTSAQQQGPSSNIAMIVNLLAKELGRQPTEEEVRGFLESQFKSDRLANNNPPITLYKE